MFSHPILRILVLCLLFFGVQVFAAELEVCPTCTYTTVGSAITAATAGDTIKISAGTYNEHSMVISEDLTIQGAGADKTIIDAQSGGRIFHVTGSGDVEFNDVTLMGGNAGSKDENDNCDDNSTGGAICMAGSGSLVVNRSNFKNNYGLRGGAVHVRSGSVHVSNSIFINNDSRFGSGLYNYSSTATSIVGCTITNNTASGHATLSNGGIFTLSGNVNIKNSIVANNSGISGKQDCHVFGGNINSDGYNIVGDGTGCPNDVDADDTDNTTEDTDIVGGSVNDIFEGGVAPTLKLGSPALDKYSCTDTKDYLGTDRPQGTNCDIGAHELIQGSPEISVTVDGTALADDTTTATINFGDTIVKGSTAPEKTITITNDESATADLSLSTFSLPTGFSFKTSAPSDPTSIAADNSTSITIQMDTANVATRNGDFTFNTNDSSESSYTITLTGKIVEKSLIMTLPTEVNEGSTVTGKIKCVGCASDLPLSVSLTSDDDTEIASSIATVELTAEDTDVDFDITGIADGLKESNPKESVTITASATGYTAITDTIDVVDMDTPRLSIANASFSETVGAQTITVTRNDTNGDISVTLTSSDTSEITIDDAEKTKTIATGSNSVEFPITIVDDTNIDGTQNVTLTATATGYDDGTATISVTDNEKPAVTDPDPPVVTPPPEPKFHNVQINITGKGSFDTESIGIKCSPPKINCTAYREDLTIEFTAEPDQGYQFKSWSGDCSRSGKVTVDERKTCQLTFEKLPTYQMVTYKAGKGSGTISTEDKQINCGSTCRAGYTADQTTTLNATVNDDKTVFTGWACVDGRQTTEPTLEIAMSQNRTCTATFAALYSLTSYVNSDGGSISYQDISCNAQNSPCSQNLPEGQIQFTANPNDGYVTIWGDECPAGKLNLNADQTCSVSFIPSYKLTLQILGDGVGAITSLPEAINCQTGTCEASYIQGDVIQLIATPEFGSSFIGWTGDCANGQTTLTMDSDKTCSATFAHTGSPQFSQDTYAVTEQDGVATITVNRLEGSNGEMNVTYAIQAVTATSQYDFINTSGVLTWADGDVEPKTFDIFINADPETEPVETAKLFLFNQTNTVLDEAELQIADTFIPANINFVRTNINATDQDSILTFAVSRSIAFTGAIQVDFVVTVGDNILTQGPLVWADGDMETKLIQIPIGAVPLGWNTLQATISNAQPDNLAILGAKNTATLTISETPSAGEVNFSNAAFSTQEGRRALIEVQRSGDNDTVASVDFILLDGTATPTTDYIATNGTLNWAKNEGGSKPIYINALRDTIVEEAETVNIQLSNPIGTKLGATSTAVLQILDATATPSTDTTAPPIEQPVLPPEPSLGVVEFAQTEYVVNEDAGSVTVKIIRAPDTSGTINVQVSSKDSTATAGHDYTALNQQLRWVNQDTTAREIQIGLLDNATVDGTRTFVLELSNTGQIDTIGEQATALITILDNDSSQVHFNADSYDIDEDAREVMLTVVRSGNGLDAASIGYRTNLQGTAKVNQDFTKTTGRIDWQAGDTRSQTVSIPIINDNVVEKNETFTVSLFTVDAVTQTISPSSVTVTIKDDDSERTEPVINPDSGNTLINGHVSNREQPIGEDGKTTFINPNGSITNSTIKGDVENEGVLIDITLSEGATVTGGIIRGSVNGSLEKPAVLKGVTIESGTILNNVIIGNGSIVADDVILGENVKFTENTVIPALNLDKLTGRITPPEVVQGFFSIFAVNLRTDVITNPAIDGILGSINGLQEFIDYGVAMQQEPNYGMLVLKYNGIVYPLLPVKLSQILPNQLRDSKPYVGLHVEHNGDVEFITHTGRRITTVPVVYAPEQFLSALNSLGLGQAVMDITGNIYISATETEYLSTRASLLSLQATDAEPGIKYINRVYLPNTTKMQFTYTDSKGILRQQIIYPASVDNTALQALTAQVDIYMDGRVEAKNAAGQIEYKGLLSYNIYQAVAEPSDTISIQEIEDVNVDGLLDYRLIYPNGDAQVLYRMQ